jgi:aryl-alcohol dehydrogenase-like predicted oxidoreductase
VVPIPGTRRRTRLDENLDALDLVLAPQDLAELAPLAARVAGERYTPELMKTVER